MSLNQSDLISSSTCWTVHKKTCKSFDCGEGCASLWGCGCGIISILLYILLGIVTLSVGILILYLWFVVFSNVITRAIFSPESLKCTNNSVWGICGSAYSYMYDDNGIINCGLMYNLVPGFVGFLTHFMPTVIISITVIVLFCTMNNDRWYTNKSYISLCVLLLLLATISIFLGVPISSHLLKQCHFWKGTKHYSGLPGVCSGGENNINVNLTFSEYCISSVSGFNYIPKLPINTWNCGKCMGVGYVISFFICFAGPIITIMIVLELVKRYVKRYKEIDNIKNPQPNTPLINK